jgi:hypothetical protein
MTEYGKQIENAFYQKCKQSGTYKRVFEDFEDGTFLMEDDVETIEDAAGWYLATYSEWAYNTMCEQVEYYDDDWNACFWKFKNGTQCTFNQLKAVLEKCV